MANCALSADITKAASCGYSLQKVSRLWLANYSDVTVTVSGNTVTGISGDTYEVEFAKDSCSFTDELQVASNGAKYRTHTLNFGLDGAYDATMAEVLDELSLGKYVAVAQLASGNQVLLGRLVPLEATVATNTGAASAGDENGISVTMAADINESALVLSDSAKLS